MIKSIEEHGRDIYYMINNDDAQSLKQVLDKFPHAVNTPIHTIFIDAYYLLHLAARKGAIECAKLLLQLGADTETTVLGLRY